MATRSFRPSRRRTRKPTDVDAVVREARTTGLARRQGYRERSLAIHGWICAKCAREFEASDLHLLTVHHRDGNHNNNPSDGSNWENLCVYCHDDEHSRKILGAYYSEGD
jgi:5-methylcytosine-specific restriction endonuclease McrA